MARAMAEDYTGSYMTASRVAKLAKRQGWALPLREYVYDVAWVMAQLICQVQYIAWNPQLAEGRGPMQSSAEAFKQYRLSPAIADAVSSGEISVPVPNDRVREWKKACCQPVVKNQHPVHTALANEKCRVSCRR